MFLRSLRFLPLICIAASLNAVCQSPTSLSLPDDPAAIMALAHEKNGLDSADVRPWHLHGSFTIYDKDGKPEDIGVYEEWWVSPNKYKRSFTSGKVTQTDYATGNGLFREGSQDWLPDAIEMRMSLLEPIPELAAGEFKLKNFDQSENKGKLKCVRLTYPLRANLSVSSDYFPFYCFETGYPALRVSSMGSSFQTVYNQLVTFQGHFLARQVHISAMGKPRLDLSLDAIEGMPTVPETLLTPPADAKPVELTTISFGKSSPSYGVRTLLKKAAPEYPESAKSSRVQGTVIIKATIERDGHVDKMTVTSGPSVLQQAAFDAVSKWVYRPIRVLGEPRAVEVEIKVIFTFG